MVTHNDAARQYTREKFMAAIEAEEDTLACLLSNPYAINKVIDTLKPEHFYRDVHATIYKAMVHLYTNQRKITVENVQDELERTGKWAEVEEHDGRSFLLGLENGTLGSVDDHAYKVIRKARARSLRYAAQEIVMLAEAEEEDAAEKALQIVSDIATDCEAETVSTFADALDGYMDDLDNERKEVEQGIAHGIPTGYPNLDRMLGGLQPRRVYTLGALTGYGKSAFAENIALNIALKSKHVMFVSLEMGRDEIVQRALSIIAEKDQSALRDRLINDMEYESLRIQAARLKRECDIKIDDGSFTIDAIIRNIKRVHARKKLDLVVIDYLQLIESIQQNKNSNRAQDVADLSKALKRLAMKLHIPVLVLVQLNREVEKRQTQEPKLSDINESGGVARDSDVVMFLWATDEELQKREAALPYQITVKVAKNRNGRMGSDVLDFAPRITKFKEPFSGNGGEEAAYE